MALRLTKAWQPLTGENVCRFGYCSHMVNGN